MRRRRVPSALLAPLVTAAVLVVVGCDGDDGRRFEAVPDTVAADEIVLELGTRVGRVTRHPAGHPPRIEGVQPARARGRRLALLAAAPSTVEYEVRVPPGAVLRVGTAVVLEEDERGGREGWTPMQFRVRVDGEAVWEHVWDPGRSRRHRRHWIDAEIDLSRFAERDVRLGFDVDASDGSGATGTPAWSRIQLLRRDVVRRQEASPATPNVLLMVVDTLRADRVGAHGGRPSRTPNLDRIGATGTVFRNAWAQAPWTLPSVATILTGRYPRGHGVVGRSAGFGRPAGVAEHEGNWAYLADTIPTIASVVRREGIGTVGITSNLLVSRENNLARGFETFVELPVSPMPVQWARAAAVHRTFGEWLAVNGRYRFFGYLHYMEPHDPYVPAPGLRDRCPAGAPEGVCDGVVREVARDREQGGPAVDESVVRHLEALYDGEVSAWDAELPGLLELLSRQGLRDRTVIVVTADHGEEFAEHGHLGHRKQLYAESLAVPFIVAGPGVRVDRRDDLVELVDVFPTVLGILGAEGHAGAEEHERPGTDLLAQPSERARTFAETRYGVVEGLGHGREIRAVRAGRWGYMQAPEMGWERLHDLAADPAETANRAPGEPAVCRTLRGELDAWMERTPAPNTAGSTEGEQITDKLRALGYVE